MKLFKWYSLFNCLNEKWRDERTTNITLQIIEKSSGIITGFPLKDPALIEDTPAPASSPVDMEEPAPMDEGEPEKVTTIAVSWFVPGFDILDQGWQVICIVRYERRGCTGESEQPTLTCYVEY